MFRQVGVLSIGLCLVSQATAEHPQIRLRPVAPADAGEPVVAADVEQVAVLLVEMTNELRRREGRRPLVVNAALAKAASEFAGFMATADKYGHTADGRKPAERVDAAGYDYCLIDENIAWLYQTRGFSTEQLARQLFDAWQQSPVHRQNLLNPHLGEIGVSVARSAKTGRYYGVQEFGRPKSEQITFEVRNSSDRELAYRVDGKPFTLEPRYGRQHKRSIPPDLQFIGHEQSPGQMVTLHPASGDRYIARRDASDRIAIEHVERESKPAATAGNGPKPGE